MAEQEQRENKDFDFSLTPQYENTGAQKNANSSQKSEKYVDHLISTKAIEDLSKFRHRRVTNADIEEFRKRLSLAVREEDVQFAYKAIISKAFSNKEDVVVGKTYEWTSSDLCDGFFTNEALLLRLLFECKFDQNYLEKSAKCETLIQALYYVHKFKENGRELPNVILIGDKNECFIVQESALDKYLQEQLNWSIAPSSAPFGNSNKSLLVKMIDDQGIAPFVYTVTDHDVDLNELFRTMEILSQIEQQVKLSVDQFNIRKAYDAFLRCVIDDNQQFFKLSPIEVVNIFIASMVYPDDTYIHPRKRNVICFKGADNNTIEKQINGSEYQSFFSKYNRDYTPSEKEKFTEIADRLIQETERRKKGDFWTPAIWAEKAQDEITSYINENWTQDFVVWDSSCGTKNLTRNLVFKELYCSTIHEEELGMALDYNPEAKSFQFDFLNDDLDISPSTPENQLLKMPKELLQALKEDKPILFIGNPPYATANEMGAQGKHKGDVAKTGMNEIMNKDRAGKASQQLFAQFLWRILKLKKDFKLSRVIIAYFIKPICFTPSDYWTCFKEQFLSEFNYKKGFLFPANDFADVSGKWGVSFCIFDSLNAEPYNNSNEYEWCFDVFKYNTKAQNCLFINKKRFYSWSEEQSCSYWIREPIKDLQNQKNGYPQMSSALKTSSSTGKPRGSLKEGALGYMVNVANNIYNSARDVWLLSSTAYKANGVSVCPENFERCIVNFAVRNSCAVFLSDFAHDKDEFHKPNEELEGYQEFVNDCAIYTFFSNASSQSSIKIKYQDVEYDLKNEFFLYPKEDILRLADRSINNSTSVYKSAKRTAKESFMCNWLSQRGALSLEAKTLYETGLFLISETMGQRDSALAEYGLDRYDAGFAQLKKLNIDKDLSARILKERRALEKKIFINANKFGMMKDISIYD